MSSETGDSDEGGATSIEGDVHLTDAGHSSVAFAAYCARVCSSLFACCSGVGIAATTCMLEQCTWASVLAGALTSSLFVCSSGVGSAATTCMLEQGTWASVLAGALTGSSSRVGISNLVLVECFGGFA